MNIHSKFLIHWTDDRYFVNPPDKEKINTNFVEKLRHALECGLYMHMETQTIYGKKNVKDMKDTWVEITVARICFTEIKLSQVQKHVQEYGSLGVGFDREFILSRYGNPIFYVQNGKNGIVVENLDLIHGFIDARDKDKNMLKNLEVVLGFIKKMSEKDEDELKYYDEMEWRIIHSDLLEKEKLIENKGDKKNPCCFLKIKPNDIKIIVFPDDKIKEMSLKDEWLKENLFDKTMPMMTTVSDCINF